MNFPFVSSLFVSRCFQRFRYTVSSVGKKRVWHFGKDLMILRNYHGVCLDRWRQYTRKSLPLVPRSRVEPDTSWVKVWSVQAWKKKSQWPRSRIESDTSWVQVRSVQGWGKIIYNDRGRESNRTHSEYKSEVFKLGEKKFTVTQVENWTGHILSTSLKFSSLEKKFSDPGRESNRTHPECRSEVLKLGKRNYSDPSRESNRTHPEYKSEVFKFGGKKSQSLRLLTFRLVFLLNNPHFLRPSHTYSSHLPFAWNCYTHRTPKAGLWLLRYYVLWPGNRSVRVMATGYKPKSLYRLEIILLSISTSS